MAENKTAPAVNSLRCIIKEGGYDPIPKKLYSLSMAFVPSQNWQNIYEHNVALARGTIFADLDLPFIGEEAVCHDRT